MKLKELQMRPRCLFDGPKNGVSDPDSVESGVCLDPDPDRISLDPVLNFLCIQIRIRFQHPDPEAGSGFFLDPDPVLKKS